MTCGAAATCRREGARSRFASHQPVCPARPRRGTLGLMTDDPAPPASAARADFADEAQLIESLRAGDEAAYEYMMREHGGRMLAVARRLLRHEEEARDALQDAFVQAFRHIGRFEAQAKLATWLHRIVVNAALMRIRSRQRHPEQSIEQLLPRYAEDGHRILVGPITEVTAEQIAGDEERRQRVRQAIDRLPESYRTILLLRDIEQFDTAQTAEILDVSDSVVKTRLHRARQALRELLLPMIAGESA